VTHFASPGVPLDATGLFSVLKCTKCVHDRTMSLASRSASCLVLISAALPYVTSRQRASSPSTAFLHITDAAVTQHPLVTNFLPGDPKTSDNFGALWLQVESNFFLQFLALICRIVF